MILKKDMLLMEALVRYFLSLIGVYDAEQLNRPIIGTILINLAQI
jgi:hypothetical protein